ncbi:MAG TPA: trehalose-6-phosphate synthase [Bryobacteraceae bacterium]|nr:trehalose-6-phosphate synthase [Bryobacteraceae bacterium]
MLKVWTREILQEFVRTKLDGYRLIVVSNREPYQHRLHEGKITYSEPAGGVTAALDPVMRACGGLWIAHGSGDADRQVVDRRDHVAVPPDNPEYSLRRIWLSKEEEAGYYGGLSNQGLWPLCHVAFTRPNFDPDHWEMYRRINQRFADAVVEEANGDPTFVFIQDYHFALLPRMLRNSNANLVVAQFWHIPWPNAEVFRAFPWREEILDGLLGNDLLGFHLPNHCQNFLDTVDRSLEARIDFANFEAVLRGHATSVKPFPIGIDFDDHVEIAESDEVTRQMKRWHKELQLDGKLLGVGIDRLDYTKGIPERLSALHRLLLENPGYREKLVFVQIAVPSRSSLPAYQQIEEEVESLTAQINLRWSTESWKPITLLRENYAVAEMIALHRLANFCVVTSLHDGMNLVAKEFAASRVDEDGVLVLSSFAGAAKELKDALLVNPFAVEEISAAYRKALEMPPDERRRRMRKMRENVEQNNVYRWAGTFLSEQVEIDFPDRHDQYPEFDPHTATYNTRALGVAV